MPTRGGKGMKGGDGGVKGGGGGGGGGGSGGGGGRGGGGRGGGGRKGAGGTGSRAKEISPTGGADPLFTRSSGPTQGDVRATMVPSELAKQARWMAERGSAEDQAEAKTALGVWHQRGLEAGAHTRPLLSST